MTNPEIKAIVRAAVRETLTELGVNASENEAIIHMQQDFAFLRRQRLASEAVGRHARLTLVGALIAGALALLWIGVKWQMSH
jgi:hypothetical protein